MVQRYESVLLSLRRHQNQDTTTGATEVETGLETTRLVGVGHLRVGAAPIEDALQTVPPETQALLADDQGRRLTNPGLLDRPEVEEAAKTDLALLAAGLVQNRTSYFKLEINGLNVYKN